MDKVITTLGTSLLRHYFGPRQWPVFLNLPYSDKEDYKDELIKLEKEISNWFDNCEKSAESATLCQMLKKGDYELFFLASDSLSTYLVGRVLERFFKKRFPDNAKKTSIKVAKNLSMKNSQIFQSGISNLLDLLFEIIKDDKSQISFNITGGYKGVIPYFSTIAQIFDCEIVYDFEGEDNRLIRIKPLPVEFDRGLLELLYPYLAFQNGFGNPKINSYLEKEGLLKDNTLTPLGKIAKYAVEKKMLNRSILGYFMEYILFEYFWNKKNKNFLNFTYERVERGKDIISSNGKKISDIDIMLENKDEYLWIEVKPLSYFYKLAPLKGQFFKKQLNAIRRYKKRLSKYVVIFYGLEFDTKNADYTNLKKFKRDIKSYGIEPEFYYLNLPIRLEENILGPKNYQQLLTNFKIDKLTKLEL